MEEMRLYQKNKDKQADHAFSEKKKYGMVCYADRYMFQRKGLKWFFYPLDEIEAISKENSSRQLRQCCGAPIYDEKMLVFTARNKEKLYLTIEETENGDQKQTEKLLKRIYEDCPQITII